MHVHSYLPSKVVLAAQIPCTHNVLIAPSPKLAKTPSLAALVKRLLANAVIVSSMFQPNISLSGSLVYSGVLGVGQTIFVPSAQVSQLSGSYQCAATQADIPATINADSFSFNDTGMNCVVSHQNTTWILTPVFLSTCNWHVARRPNAWFPHCWMEYFKLRCL